MADLAQQIREQYGFSAWVLDDPGLKAVFTDAVNRGVSPNEFRSMLEATDYYKTHANAWRDTKALEMENPAEFNREVDKIRQNISSLSGQLGVPIAGDRQQALAGAALRFGWSDAELRNAIASEFHYSPQQQANQPSSIVQDVKTQARQYLVPLSDGTIDDWSRQIMAGEQTPENFRAYLIGQASSMFPGLRAALEKGDTVEKYADPYRQLAAQTLEIAPESIDFMQPKWMKALNQVDPKTGERTSMDLHSWSTEIRKNEAYGFQYTKQANDQVYETAQQIAKGLGQVA